MARIKFIIALALVSMIPSDARTVDGGKIDDAIIRGHFPPMGPNNLPMIKQREGLNDIQVGLKDKADPEVKERKHDVISTTPYAPTIPETNDIEPIVEEEEKPEVIETVEYPADSPDEEFDPDLFQEEGDLVIVMRRMYEALTKRMGSLKTRVSTVEQTTSEILARLTDLDCADLQTRGQTKSGIYTLHMDHNGKRPVDVVCDMDTDGGGWTLIQRRNSKSKDVDFNRGWFDYKMGFGNISSDFWIGLENIFIWTNTRHYQMRIELTDFAGETSYAQYEHFYIESEDNAYRLHISDYNGTSGDSMGNEGKADNFTADGMMFTTYDEDHDTSHEINCAKYWNIGGWWFNRCSWANLNGPYREPGEGDGIGINWHMWRNKEYLRESTIMIRPIRNF